MAPRLQPKTLLELSHAQVATNLANTCRILHNLAQETCVTYVLNLSRKYLRPIWQQQVPSSIRAELLQETMSLLGTPHTSEGAYGAAPLYLLVLLLAPNIQHIVIQLCCYYGCSHQTALLKFLASEGSGLESLELSRSTLLRLDQNLLQSVLISATLLKQLTFRNIANDNILQTIGNHCPNLESLDVSHSREVTNFGIQQLLLSAEFRDKCVHILPERSNNKTVLDRYSRVLKNIIRTFQRVCKIEKNSKKKNLTTILEYCEKRNNLCSTLKELNIANTGVSSTGILLAIGQAPNLETLGEYCHIGRALELLEETKGPTSMLHTTYKLKFVNSCRTNLHRLELISNCFPQVEKLKISDPTYPPKSLFLIPESTTHLHLQSIPSTENWVHGIYDYLNSCHGKSLKELSLRFFPGDTLPRIELGKFIQHCANLNTITIDGAIVDWTINTKNSYLPQLEKIQLGKIITVNALHNVINKSPKLKIIHVYSCLQFNVKELIQKCTTTSCSIVKRSNIECLHIYETSSFTEDSMKELITSLHEIKQIGNVRNCGLNPKEMQSLQLWILRNNYNVLLDTGSHWFSSSCFPIS